MQSTGKSYASSAKVKTPITFDLAYVRLAIVGQRSNGAGEFSTVVGIRRQ
ncbi:MAG: hypothetical protein LH481_13185 [Burkholderiales bacterium]|nr:hypothetical protein [Burkholderiales bacterium]